MAIFTEAEKTICSTLNMTKIEQQQMGWGIGGKHPKFSVAGMQRCPRNDSISALWPCYAISEPKD